MDSTVNFRHVTGVVESFECVLCLTFFAVFYDIGSPKARAENQELKININLDKRSVSTRLWEIRISQIPFSSKAPTGCMQFFTGSEGKYLRLLLSESLVTAYAVR